MGGARKTTLRKEGASRTDLYYIEPEKIVVDWDENPRVDYGDVESLSESIAHKGVQVPIKVYSKDGKLHLAHGFRRMKATLMAIERGEKVEKIPAQQVANNMESILEDHFTLNSGKPITVLEQANGIIKLMNMSGASQAEISRRISMATSRVNVLVTFGEQASTKLKKAVEDGVIGFDKAIRLIRDTDGVKEQNEALDKAIDISAGENNGKKKRKVSLTAVKRATGNKTLSPFERVLKIGDELEGTEFGEKFNHIIRMARDNKPIEEVKEYLGV
jgi:hypothetical protein